MTFWKKTIYIILLFTILSCQNNNSNKENEEIEKNEIIDITPKLSYSEFIDSLNLDNLNPKERSERFFKFINEDVPTYWTGTKWDFHGVTRTPKNGTIACGYFVTNTLSDFKIKLKRIWLAQQASSVMIEKLCKANTIKRFSTINKLTDYILKGENQEIFIVGLDFHTGYIIKDKQNIYFLHSNYINKQGVIKERLINSVALRSSKSFMIGSLTKNSNLF